MPLDHMTNANLVNGKEENVRVKSGDFQTETEPKIASSYKSRISDAENEFSQSFEEKRSADGLSPR